MSNTTTSTSTFTTEAYAAADAKGKAALRAAIQKAITEAITKGDLAGAQALVATQSTFTTVRESVEVDWTQRVVDLHATLTEALRALESGSVVMPEGVEVPDLSEVVWEGGTWTEADVRALCTVKGRKAGRGAVVDYIDSVLGDEPMTIAQIRAAWVASEDYPKAAPSAGAIGAALVRIENGAEAPFEACDIDGKRGAQR